LSPSILDFTLDPAGLGRLGHGMSRAENVLGFRDGTVFAGSDKPWVTRIAPDGAQQRLGAIPGGELATMAVESEEALLVSSTSDGNVYRLRLDGRHELYLDGIDGHPHGRANFVFRDTQRRTWIVVATATHEYPMQGYEIQDDGYVILVDGRGPRVVASGLCWPNEIRFDAGERHAFVPETFGRRLLRYTVGPEGDLLDPEPIGPDPLGEEIVPDGIALDADGNVWIASLSTNGLLVVTPDGQLHTVFEDRNQPALDAWLPEFEKGRFTVPLLRAWAGPTLQLPTSIAFAGPDLRTVVMGSLAMTELLTFNSPVGGLPLWHQSLPAAPDLETP
jgi:sugar lactone lactonase YvrE